MTTISTVIALLIVFGIAFAVAKSGKKKIIGFNWSFYFTLLMPILGIIMTVISRKQDGKIKKSNIILKIIAILCFIYGLFLLLGAITIKELPTPLVQNENAFERQARETGEVQTGNNKIDMYINEQITRLSAVIGNGILSLTLDVSELKSNGFKYRRMMKLNAGLIVFLLGVFLIRDRKVKSINPVDLSKIQDQKPENISSDNTPKDNPFSEIAGSGDPITEIDKFPS